MGDMIRITSLRNENLDIDSPQMVFYGRADDLVEVTKIGRLTERIIQQAMENTSIPYIDWVARREIIADKPVLHIYLELKDDYIASEKNLSTAILEEFKKLDNKYRCNFYRLIGDMESVLGLKPVEVTLLPRGAFFSYISQCQAKRVAPGEQKLPRVNPPEEVLSLLRVPKVVVEAAEVTEGERAPVR